MTGIKVMTCTTCGADLVYAKGFGYVCPNPTDHERADENGVSTYAR